MAHQLENALKRSPKLHGFRGRVGERRVVDGVPRVVTEESGLAFALFFHHGGRELKVREMRDGTVRQNGPKTVVNELRHFFAQEGGMFDGRMVAPMFDAGLFGLG